MFLRYCFCEIFELMGKFHTTTGGHVVQSTINRVILILGSYLLHSRTSHTSLMRTEQQQQQQKKIEQYITIYKSATIEMQNQRNTISTSSINQTTQNQRRPNESSHHCSSHQDNESRAFLKTIEPL